MATFMDRLKQTVGERGYEPALRRSIQTILLYEAYRCIASRIPGMRPFQRKLAFFDQVQAVVAATEFLPHQRQEIMWRTGTSKDPMNADTAWKRMKLIEKELEKLRAKIKPLCVGEKSHDTILNQYIQQQYELVSGSKDKAFPPGWEYSHNNVLMTYRMYYDGHDLDPTFPPPTPFKEIVVPAAKPKVGDDPGFMLQVQPETSEAMGGGAGSLAMNKFLPSDGFSSMVESADERVSILNEVRTHLDLLNDFVGIIPQDLLNKRKRELFQALPSAPPSTIQRTSKKARTSARGDESDDGTATDPNFTV